MGKITEKRMQKNLSADIEGLKEFFYNNFDV